MLILLVTFSHSHLYSSAAINQAYQPPNTIGSPKSSLGSGAVESTIKQINRRIQLSGAQWNRDNVPQVLAHRCAYLNPGV